MANSAVIAIIASLLVISAYVALRFSWKFAIPVLIALMHDLLITSGVYALTGREVTVDTVAALLTILGYSLYDTIIVFDRVRENIPRMPRAAFSQIVNRSMSEVLTRSLATTSCTLLPILALLLFGGSTLKDFAFALLIGVASGAYSSIFIASPVLTHWKERESVYRHRRERIEADHGFVAPYAAAGADVEPARDRVRRRAGRITEPDPEGVSAAEFEQMKRDIADEEAEPRRRTSTLTKRLAHTRDGEGDGTGAGRAKRSGGNGGRSGSGGGGRAPVAAAAASGGRAGAGGRGGRAGGRSSSQPQAGRGAAPPPTPTAPSGHAARRSGEAGRAAGRRGLRARPRRGRGRGHRPPPEAGPLVQAAPGQPPPRETSLMGMLAWVMMGLALWHFTIWLPDRYWGGIVGAFVGCPDRLGALRVPRQRPGPSPAATTPT